MNKIVHILVGAWLGFASFFGHHNAPVLGAAAGCSNGQNFSPAQTQVFYLSGSGINSNATSVLLTSMNYSNGTAVTMCDLGQIAFATIDPGFPNKEEQVSFTNIIQNSNGTALLQGVTRGLAFNPGTQGCGGSATYSISHAGAAQFVLSNTACYYQQFAILANSSTITGQWNFSGTVPTSNVTNASDASSPQNLVTQASLASTSFAGVVNGSTVQKGIFQEATSGALAAGTGVGSTGADLLVPSSLTKSSSSATTLIPVTDTNGKIDPGFINQSANYNLTGSNTLASTTFTATTTFQNPPVGIFNYFGNGRDGVGTISATTTLTRDMYYTNLTINANLFTGGYRIFVNGIATGTGAIIAPTPNNAAPPANNTSTATSFSQGGTSTVAGDFINQPGGSGSFGSGCSGQGNGNNGSSTADINSIGNNGGVGGQGQTSGGSGGLGGTTTAASTTSATFGSSAFSTYMFAFLNPASTTFNVFTVGTGGGGGGGGAHQNSSESGVANGTGGGGGASGYPIFLFVNNWGGSFTIQANGGNAANGIAGNCSSATGGGGGGGGAGGNSVVVYATKVWIGSYNLVGGNPGLGFGSASNGATGTTGTSYEIKVNSFTLP